MNKRFVSGAGRGKSGNSRKDVRFRPPMIGLLAVVVLAFSPMLSAQSAGHMEMMPMPMMSSLFPGLPMSREGSGTSWQPDSSPIYAWHVPAGKWTFMIHGGAFLRYTS